MGYSYPLYPVVDPGSLQTNVKVIWRLYLPSSYPDTFGYATTFMGAEVIQQTEADSRYT